MNNPLTRYIADEAHYNEVIARMGAVKRELWVGTSDMKDVYIKQGRGEAAPLLGMPEALALVSAAFEQCDDASLTMPGKMA